MSFIIRLCHDKIRLLKKTNYYLVININITGIHSLKLSTILVTKALVGLSITIHDY